MMNSLGYSPSEEDIQAVISKIDIDGKDSTVVFDEKLFFFQETVALISMNFSR